MAEKSRLMFLLLKAIAVAVSSWSVTKVKKFLATTPVIADQESAARR